MCDTDARGIDERRAAALTAAVTYTPMACLAAGNPTAWHPHRHRPQQRRRLRHRRSTIRAHAAQTAIDEPTRILPHPPTAHRRPTDASRLLTDTQTDPPLDGDHAAAASDNPGVPTPARDTAGASPRGAAPPAYVLRRRGTAATALLGGILQQTGPAARGAPRPATRHPEPRYTPTPALCEFVRCRASDVSLPGLRQTRPVVLRPRPHRPVPGRADATRQTSSVCAAFTSSPNAVRRSRCDDDVWGCAWFMPYHEGLPLNPCWRPIMTQLATSLYHRMGGYDVIAAVIDDLFRAQFCTATPLSLASSVAAAMTRSFAVGGSSWSTRCVR